MNAKTAGFAALAIAMLILALVPNGLWWFAAIMAGIFAETAWATRTR